MNGAPPNTWRNTSRFEESFNDQLYAQLRNTPWWLISILFHAALVGLMFSLDFGPGRSADAAMVKSDLDEEVLEPPVEVIEPQIRESELIEQPETPLVEPETPDAKVDPRNEDDNDRPHQETLGKLDLNSDAPFDGPMDNATIGIGGAAGGGMSGRGGRRNLRGGGGGSLTEEVVDLGLEWLKNHQDPDGSWDCDGFSAQCKGGICDGPGRALYDPGVTGLSLLAFLGAGHTNKHGQYRETVRRGLRYLKQIQDPEGCFGPRTTKHFTYSHSIATLAMVEAFGLTGSPLLKRSAQRAVDFVHTCQNPYLAWRYGVRPGDNDTSVTGWMIMALKSAKMVGLRVDPATFDGTKAWLNKVTEPEYGRVGYTARGTGPARPEDLMDRFPADRSESLTAVGVLARIFVGEDPRESEMIRKGVDLCLKSLPVWDESSGSIDMYYWYYGTLALFQVGGEAWETWNDALKTAVIGTQRRDGCQKGSWDPIGPWGRDGGRVYATALNVMCMEVYYRYDRVAGSGYDRAKARKKNR